MYYSEELTRLIKKLSLENPDHVDITHNDKIIRLNVRRNDNILDYMTTMICYYNNFYEFPLLKHIEENRLNQKTIIDIGANIGNHTCFFENFLNFEKIICFEPDPINFQVLCSNIKSPKTIAYPVAVSDVKGRGSLFKEEWYNGGTFTLIPGDSIEVIKLDDLMNDIKDVTLMKIDVEGHEFNVLNGAKLLIERDHPTIYAEIKEQNKDVVVNLLNSFGYKTQSILEFDASLTYEFY